MKITFTQTVQVEKEIKFAGLLVPIGEDDYADLPDMLKGMLEPPRYNGDKGYLRMIVDLDTKAIVNFPEGTPGFCLYLKPCDSGNYAILDENRTVVFKIQENYVPNKAFPPSDGCGDYLRIDFRDGRWMNFYDVPDFSAFWESDEDE